MKSCFLQTVFVLLFVWPFGVRATAIDDTTAIHEQSSDYFFNQEETIKLKVICKLKTVTRDVKETRQWHIATGKYWTGKDSVSFPIRLQTRGHYRRKRSVCSFPPMKFDFPCLHNVPRFADVKKLKFVTHCRTREIYQQNILVEYLIYKMYSVLTEESYKVRLAKVIWEDSEGKEEPVEKWGFFIENTKQLAKRLEGRIINIPNVHQDKTDYEKVARLAIFQYMIGNTDWGVSSLHNIKLIVRNPYKPPIAVPYDFDWSGIINAPYAKPLPQFGTQSVTERVYRGFYRSKEELAPIIQQFKDHKEEFYEIVTGCELLSEKKKADVIGYLDSFYETIDEERAVRNEFIANCREDDF